LIASQAGFAQRQVAEYLALLTDSGFAERWSHGRTVQYRLAPDFVASLGPLAAYVDWAGAWSVLANLWAAADESRNLSGYAASKVWRNALQTVRTATPIPGTELPVPVPEDYPGESILDYADEYVLQAADAVDVLAR
jgi:hypothetical protein